MVGKTEWKEEIRKEVEYSTMPYMQTASFEAVLLGNASNIEMENTRTNAELCLAQVA